MDLALSKPSEVVKLLGERLRKERTSDMREEKKAYERAVFNDAFNNRNDHPKNFAYIMSPTGQWYLAPARETLL